MSNTQKLRTLLTIVECVPAAREMTVFQSAARRGDLAAFWAHYQETLGRSTDAKQPAVTSNGEVSFAMIEPAMTVVHDLPTR